MLLQVRELEAAHAMLGRNRAAKGLHRVKHQGVDLRFGYISARPLERIQAENLPAANYAVANNGAYIWTNDGVQQTLDSSWEQRKLQSGFRAERAFELANQLLKDPRYAGLRAQTVGEVVGSDGADACPDMAGFCFANESVRLGRGERAAHLDPEHFRAPRQVQQFAGELSRLLQKEGAEFSISPVYPFHGKPYVMFDLASVNKGDAIRRLSEREQVSPDHVIVAGDGGNDIAMMGDGRRAIVVGGNSALRKAAAELPHAILEDPSVDCSLGVLAGLKQHVAEIAREHRAG